MIHSEEKLKDDAEFEVQGELPKPKEEQDESAEKAAENGDATNNGSNQGVATSSKNGASATVINDDDDGKLTSANLLSVYLQRRFFSLLKSDLICFIRINHFNEFSPMLNFYFSDVLVLDDDEVVEKAAPGDEPAAKRARTS